MRLLPLITLGACALAIAQHHRAQRHRHDLHHAQAQALKHQREAALLRSTNGLLHLALAQAQARAATRQQLHQASGWSQLPDRPAWYRPHPPESQD